MANILILGGGFGGLVAAEQLSDSLGEEHRITLVSPSERFVFYPALVRLAFGECEPDDISFSLIEKLNKMNVRFVQGEVIGINFDSKRVEITGKDFKGEIFYDYLIIAMGRRLATEKIRGYYENANHLLNVETALDFGEDIRAFREGNIVIGMSPQSFLPVPACEVAFTFANKYKSEIKKGNVSINVVFPESVQNAFAGADLHSELIQAFVKHNIYVTTDFPTSEITEAEIISENGRKVPYDLLMLVPPFRGHSFFDKKLEITNELDFIKIDEAMRVYKFKGVYAVGDIVNFSGPKLAQMAVRQARIAAANIVSEIKGKEPKESYYHEIATVIDQGGADSIYLYYGIWNESLYSLKKGKLWSLTKRIHDKLWRAAHYT